MWLLRAAFSWVCGRNLKQEVEQKVMKSMINAADEAAVIVKEASTIDRKCLSLH